MQRALIEEIKYKEAKKLAETHSCQSRCSRRSNSSCSNSTTSSAARMKALAEAAAARENAQFERLIAEKEHAHKEREAEIERKHQQERTEHEKELSILAANRKVAMADAKLKAIERVIDEGENESKDEISEMPKLKSKLGQKTGFELTLRCKIRLKKHRANLKNSTTSTFRPMDCPPRPLQSWRRLSVI